MHDVLDILERLVNIESPSADVDGNRSCLREVARIASEWLGDEGEILESMGRPCWRWRGSAEARIGLLGHADTVWPLGTAAAWPFHVEGDRATGPGVFDMKAGIVQGLLALRKMDADRASVEMLLTSDEETGATASREVLEEFASRMSVVLVLEPSAGGALKVARKGAAFFRVKARGRAAHAGLEPESGVNALVELGHALTAVPTLADSAKGTTVTPTQASGGTAVNVVPSDASVTIDVRAWETEELRRVHDALLAMRPQVEGAQLSVEGGINRAALEDRMSADLFSRAAALAPQAGVSGLTGERVGGGSDGNITAGLGVPTLDGLGAVGAGAHAEGEHIFLPDLMPRAELLRLLVRDLLERPL